MGKFDGILLATDWDGTLARNGEIPKENIEAIRYFQENGGSFTVCSGRFSDYLLQFSDVIDFKTYLICCNGAFIVDPKNAEVLHKDFCDDYLFDIVEKIFINGAKFDFIRFFVDKEDSNLDVRSYDDFLQMKEKLTDPVIYKAVIIHKTEENALYNKKMLESSNVLRDYIAVRSWREGLEFVKYKNSKGEGVRRVAKALGSRLIVTAGDFENDIELIKAADIGYAVGNAIDSVKAIANRITVDVEEGAIASIISDLDKEFS